MTTTTLAMATKPRVFLAAALLLLLPLPSARSRRQAVEDVTRRRLDELLEAEDYLAVFWCRHFKLTF